MCNKRIPSFYGRNLNVHSAHKIREWWGNPSAKKFSREFNVNRVHLLTALIDEARSGHFSLWQKVATWYRNGSRQPGPQSYLLPNDLLWAALGLGPLLTQRAGRQLKCCQSRFLPCLDLLWKPLQSMPASARLVGSKPRVVQAVKPHSPGFVCVPWSHSGSYAISVMCATLSTNIGAFSLYVATDSPLGCGEHLLIHVLHRADFFTKCPRGSATGFICYFFRKATKKRFIFWQPGEGSRFLKQL